MSWITAIWSMNAGICLALAGVYLLAWFRLRKSWVNLAFVFCATSTASIVLFELLVMRAQTTIQYGELLRWAHVPVAILVLSLVWFIRLYLQAGRAWLLWSIYAVRALALVVNFTAGPNINFSEITALHQIVMWGEITVVPIGVESPWEILIRVSEVLLLVFIVDAAVGAWRQGVRHRALIMGIALFSTILGAASFSLMMVLGKLPMPMNISLPFMIFILIMGYQLSNEIVHARRTFYELEETHKRMSLAAKEADLSIWEWNIEKDEIWTTDVGRARIGAGESERISLDRFLQSVHPDDREATRQTIKSLIEKESNPKLEYRMVSSDGHIQWIANRGHVERDSNGKPCLIRGIAIDITKSKQAEETLRESEKRLKEAQHITHVGNWELDLLTNTLTWSDEIFRIFEIEREHFGASYEAFLNAVHPEDRDAVNAAYTNSLETRKPYDIIHRLLMPDGRIKYVHEQCKTFYSPDGKPLRSIGTVQDITTSKEAEIERIQLRNELAHLSRALTMSEISVSLAHEINQPLGAILNNARAVQIISSKLQEGNEEVEEILADIIADANRAGEIVRRIRGIVKKSELSIQLLHCNSLIKEVTELYRNLFITENVLLVMDLQHDLLPIRGDRIRLQQVLMNLINNAIEAMKKSSSKTLTIRSTMQSPDTVNVSISDSGTGIDVAKKDKMFRPFFTTKKDGLGMGLRICRSIIEEEHGGSIWAKNNPVAGATFSFSLKVEHGDSG